MKRKDLDGKVIIVAGGSGGIGNEVCKLLTTKGAQIIIIGRSAVHRSELANELKSRKSKFVYIQKDLSEIKEWEALINYTLIKFERIDILINSIGVVTPGCFSDLEIKQIDENVQTNFLSVIYGCKAILPIFKKQGYGHIINIGSLGGIVAVPYETIYSATKFGVRGFTLSLAGELKTTGIKVTLISPGPVKTKLLDIESTDDNSTLTFVSRILCPSSVAQKVLKIIYRPRGEVILPNYLTLPSLLVNGYTKLFEKTFPLLNNIGRRKLKEYRRKYFNPPKILKEN